MTDQRREQRTYPPRSAYMQYTYTTEMARRHERQRQMAQLDDEVRRDKAMMLKRMHDSRMKTEKAIRDIRLEQESRLIKEKQRLQEHEARRRVHRQNREQLERELERIKNEQRAKLAKEDVKCQKTEEDESEQHEEESKQHEEEESEQHEEESEQQEEDESKQHEEERKMLTFIQQNEVSLKHTEGRQPVAALKRREHKQRNHERMALAAGQIHVHERIQYETEEEEQRKDTERENENKTCMVNDVTSDEKREKEVQTNTVGTVITMQTLIQRAAMTLHNRTAHAVFHMISSISPVKRQLP